MDSLPTQSQSSSQCPTGAGRRSTVLESNFFVTGYGLVHAPFEAREHNLGRQASPPLECRILVFEPLHRPGAFWVDARHPRAAPSAPSAPSAVRWSALPASVRPSVCTGRLAWARLLPPTGPPCLRWLGPGCTHGVSGETALGARRHTHERNCVWDRSSGMHLSSFITALLLLPLACRCGCQLGTKGNRACHCNSCRMLFQSHRPRLCSSSLPTERECRLCGLRPGCTSTCHRWNAACHSSGWCAPCLWSKSSSHPS
jgi:hypothetical protein